MTDIINIAAEDNRNILDDDAVPTLTLTNTNASGTGLKVENTNATSGDALDVDSTAGAAIDADGALVSTIHSTATAASALEVGHASTILASVTVAPLKIVTSAASGALVDFGVIDSGAVVSVATSGPTLSARVRVKFGDQYGWINIHESL